MSRGSVITGTVTHKNGNPISQLCVTVYQKNGDEFQQQWQYWGETTVTGQYTVSRLAVGTYRVAFLNKPCNKFYQYYDNKSNLENAKDIVVNVEETITNINAILPNPPHRIPVHVSIERPDEHGAGVYIDPVNGETTIQQSYVEDYQSDITVSIPGQRKHNRQSDNIPKPTDVVVCTNGYPTHVELQILSPIDSQLVYTTAMTEIIQAGDVLWQGTIPAGTLNTSGTYPLQVTWNCGDETFTEGIGDIVLYDPSGYITDSTTQKPIEEAVITLYKVPGWLPKQTPHDNNPQSCQSHLSKTEYEPWNQTAPTHLGVIVEPNSPEISPQQNPQITNFVGYYHWDVAQGCWYVKVSAKGYQPKFSPVVGVPPEVTDLHLTLDPYPALQFSQVAYQVQEIDGVATITVTSLTPLTQAVQVNYATYNITAMSGRDYQATSGILTFKAGDTRQTFTIPITNDLDVEDDRSVLLTLSQPLHVELATRTQAVLTIVSDDEPVVGKRQQTYLPVILR